MENVTDEPNKIKIDNELELVFKEYVCELHDSVGKNYFKNKMDELAKFVLKKCKLRNDSIHKEFFLTEIEFYLCCNEHEDPYCHSFNKYKEKKDHIQNRLLHWYFHGSGMDITIGGDNDSGIYGGILIRSVYDISSGKEINGPLNTRYNLLGLDSLANKIENCNKKMKEMKLLLVKDGNEYVSDISEENFVIVNTPRHGLNPIKEIKYDSKVETENGFIELCGDSYYCKNYRYKIIKR